MADTDLAEPTLQNSAMQCLHRGPDDDFFCLRYQVWYPSFDCAIRTKFETAPGCLLCEQGRFNLRRHSDALHRRHQILTAGILEP